MNDAEIKAIFEESRKRQAEEPVNRYFNIQKDKAIIKKGGFMCNGCLIGKPLSQQSPKDARYCVDCQPIIEYEYALSAEHSGRKSRYEERAARELDVCKEKTILSRTNPQNIYECQKEARPPLLPSRGRPRKDIPFGLIHKLAKEGLSLREIAKELKGQEIEVSYRTISRVLSGERTAP